MEIDGGDVENETHDVMMLLDPDVGIVSPPSLRRIDFDFRSCVSVDDWMSIPSLKVLNGCHGRARTWFI